MLTDPRAQAIRAMLDQFEGDVNTRVPEAIGPYLAEDTTFITPQAEGARGREQVQQLIVAGMNKGMTPEGGIAFEIATIRFLPGDFAFVDLIEKVTGLRFPGGKTGDVDLHVAALLGLSEGKWVWSDGRPHAYLPRPDTPS